MTDKTITELTEKTAAIDADQLSLWDSVAGETKKIKYQNLKDHAPKAHTHPGTDVTSIVGDSEKLEGSTKTQVQDHAPNAHKTSHQSGQADAINLTELVGKGYALFVQALTSSPTDSVSRYFGNLPKAPMTAGAVSKIYIRKAGKIKIAEIYCYSGTAGTAEAWSLYIRLNNTTDYLIATLSVSALERVFSNAELNIAVAVGNYIEIKMVNPLWATNPLTTIFGGYIYIE
jgi:hypothetical protein